MKNKNGEFKWKHEEYSSKQFCKDHYSTAAFQNVEQVLDTYENYSKSPFINFGPPYVDIVKFQILMALKLKSTTWNFADLKIIHKTLLKYIPKVKDHSIESFNSVPHSDPAKDLYDKLTLMLYSVDPKNYRALYNELTIYIEKKFNNELVDRNDSTQTSAKGEPVKTVNTLTPFLFSKTSSDLFDDSNIDNDKTAMKLSH